jgi:preprotein translocase subunit SecD
MLRRRYADLSRIFGKEVPFWSAHTDNLFDFEVVFTKEGAEKIARAIEERVGKLLAIIIDERVVSTPVVRGRLSSDKALIGIEVTKEEAEWIVRGINRQ